MPALANAADAAARWSAQWSALATQLKTRTRTNGLAFGQRVRLSVEAGHHVGGGNEQPLWASIRPGQAANLCSRLGGATWSFVNLTCTSLPPT